MSQIPTVIPIPTVADHAKYKDVQGRRWCYVAYDIKYFDWLQAQHPVAHVAAWEIGGTGGARHIQGYIKFQTNKRWSWWFSNVPKDAAGKYSIGWKLANGAEWQCRRYIADVAAYLASPQCDHHKTQGEIIIDQGCEPMLYQTGDQTADVVQSLANGAEPYQIFKEHPRYYFIHYNRVHNLHERIVQWKREGLDYMPTDFKEGRYKKAKRAQHSRSEDVDPDCDRPSHQTDVEFQE